MITCARDQDWDGVLRELRNDPNAAREKDEKVHCVPHSKWTGNTALHFAVMKGAHIDVVRALLDANPDSAAEPNKAGSLPLHLAAYFDASVEIIQLLVHRCPAAVKVENKLGDVPGSCNSDKYQDVINEALRSGPALMNNLYSKE